MRKILPVLMIFLLFLLNGCQSLGGSNKTLVNSRAVPEIKPIAPTKKNTRIINKNDVFVGKEKNTLLLKKKMNNSQSLRPKTNIAESIKSRNRNNTLHTEGGVPTTRRTNPNKFLPIDYKANEINSREIWYRDTFYSRSSGCRPILESFGRITFLRSGNIILRIKTSRASQKYTFMDMTVKPVKGLTGVAGINGLKLGKNLVFEANQEIRSIGLSYIYGKKLKRCSLELGTRLSTSLRKHTRYEKLHAKAVKLARKRNQVISPILRRRETEKIAPKIIVNKYQNRTDAYNTFIRGKVTDNEGVMTVMVNGRKAGVKADGTFAARVKLAFGINRISVKAEDVNGNISEKKLAIIREEFIPEQTLADVDIPPKTRMKNPNGIAVVIGVENYQYVSDATYAYNDAEVFREYLADTLGYKKSRVKIATNSKATLAELNKLLGPNGWIARNVKAKASDVVVYFSGHGIPDAKTKKTGLLPFDVDPNYSVGLTLKDLYTTLGNLDAKSVTVFLDACFSGQTREKKSLLADARGIMVVPLEKNVSRTVTVISAATAGQISGPLKDKEHGLFTYFLLKGLGGVADTNQDRKLTVSELAAYVKVKVKEQSSAKGWDQTPEIQGASDRVLVQF